MGEGKSPPAFHILVVKALHSSRIFLSSSDGGLTGLGY